MLAYLSSLKSATLGADVRGPRVTVMIITYNHSKFIARALDSVLEQKVDFPLAIHVIDDCSTDGAQDIIRDYAARYPGVVIPFINEVNIGREVTQKNFYRGMCTLDGDYMAILEGDDCWTSPERLRSHVEFLEANPDYVACAHNVLKVFEDGSKPELYIKGAVKETHDIDDLIALRSFFHASSLTFRNVFRGRVPRYLRSPLSCDIFINIAHAQYGKIHYTPDVWSLYQVHAGGMFSSMSQTRGWMWNIDSFVACNRWLGYRYLLQFAETIYRYCTTLDMQGREEDGLTPEKRLAYTALRKRYRRLAFAYRRLDMFLARWVPGRRARGAPAKLNLGSGARLLLDCVNVDVRRDLDPDLVVDLERTPWPWPDNYAEEVRLTRSLEELGADLRTFDAVMRELYRVCRPGARVRIVARHPAHDSFVDDPACVRVVSPDVLKQFDALASGSMALGGRWRRRPIDFEIVGRSAVLDEPYKTRLDRGELSSEAAGALMRSQRNVCRELRIELRAHKPPRAPSPPRPWPASWMQRTRRPRAAIPAPAHTQPSRAVENA